MVDYRGQQLDGIFHALSDETRRAILARLVQGECSVTELAEPFRMSLAAVSKHIKVLEDAGLVRKEKEGRSFRCRAHFESLGDASTLLEQLAGYWNGRLSALEQFLATDAKHSIVGEPNDGTSRSTASPGTRHPARHSRKKRKGV